MHYPVNNQLREDQLVCDSIPICTRLLQLVQRPTHALEFYWTVALYDTNTDERLNYRSFRLESEALDVYNIVDALYRKESKDGVEDMVMEILNQPNK